MADAAEALPRHEEDKTGLSESDSTVCKGDGITCAECGKHFSHPFYFSTHISTHVSEKIFPVVGQCALCGIVFGDPEIFTQHLTSSQNKLAEQESAKEAEENLISSGDIPEPDLNDLPIGGSPFGMEEVKPLPKSKQTKRLSQDKKSEVNKRTIVPSTKVPDEEGPLPSNTKVAAGTSSSRRKRKAPERYISDDDFAGVKAPSAPSPSDADSEVEAYLRSLSALGYTVDPEAFATPPRKKQGGGKLSGPARGRAQGRGRGQSFFVLPPIDADDMVGALEPQPPPRKPSPKYEYIDDDMSEFLEDDLEVLPKSGKLTRAQRLEKRLERLSQDGGEKKAIRHVYVSEDSPPRKSRNTGKGNKNFSPNKHPVIKPGMKNPKASIELDIANTDNDHLKHFKQGSPVPSKVPTARRGGTNTSNPLFGARMYGNFMPKHQTQRFERGRGQMPPGGTMSRGSKFPLFPDATRSLTAKVTGNLEKTKQSSREYVEKMLMSVQSPNLAPSPFNRSNSSSMSGQKGRGGQGILSNSGLFLGRSTSNAGTPGAGSNPRGMGSNNQRSVQRGSGHMASSGTYRHQGPQNFQNQRAGRGSNIGHNIGLNNRGRGSDQQGLAHGNNFPRSSATQNNPFRNGQLHSGRGGGTERLRGSSPQNPFPVGSPSRIQGSRAGVPPPAKQQRMSADTGEVIVIDDEDEFQIRRKDDSNHRGNTESADISRKGEKSVAIRDVGLDSSGSQIETIENKGNPPSESGSSRRKSIPRRSENWNKADEMESESEDDDSDTEHSNVKAVDERGNDDDNENQEEEIMEGENIDGWKVCIAEDSESGEDDNFAEEAKPTSPKKNRNEDNPTSSSEGDIPPSSSEEDNQPSSSKEDTLLSSSKNQSTEVQRGESAVKGSGLDDAKSKEKKPSSEEPMENLPDIPTPSKGNSEGKESEEIDRKTDGDKSNTNVVPITSELDDVSHTDTEAGKFGASVDFTVEFSNDLFSNLVSEELDTIGEETSRSVSENSEAKDGDSNPSKGQLGSTFPKAVSEVLRETEESSNLSDGSQNLSAAQTSRELVSENSGTPNTTSTNSDLMGNNDDIVDIFTEIEKACKEIEENSSERENYGDDGEEGKEMESGKKKESFSSLREGLEKAMANEGRLIDTENMTERKASGCGNEERCDNDLEEDGIADAVEEGKKEECTHASGISDDSEKNEKVEKESGPEAERSSDAKLVREKVNGGPEKIEETSKSVSEFDGKSSNEPKKAGDVLAKTPNKRSKTGIGESEWEESQTAITEQVVQSPEMMEDDTELVKDQPEQPGGGSENTKISDENSKCHSTNDMNPEVDRKIDKSLKENEDDRSEMDQTDGTTERPENKKTLVKENEGLNVGKPSFEILKSAEKAIASHEFVKDSAESTSANRERTLDEKIDDLKGDERYEEENANEDSEAAIYQRILKSAMDDKGNDAIYSSERLSEGEEDKVDEDVGNTSKATEERGSQDSSEIMDIATEEMKSNMQVTGDRAENEVVDGVIDRSVELGKEKADDDKSEKIGDSPHGVEGAGDASESQRRCESVVTEKNENTDDTNLIFEAGEEEKEEENAVTDSERPHGDVADVAAGKFISDSERTENDVNKTSEEAATRDVGSGASESGSSVDAKEGGGTSTEKDSASGKTEEKSEDEKKQRNMSSCKDNSIEGIRQKNGDDDDDDKDNGGSGSGGGHGNQSSAGSSNCNVAATNGTGNTCSSTASTSNVDNVDNDEVRLEPESSISIDSDMNNKVLNIPLDACSSSVPLSLIQGPLILNSSAGAGLETGCPFGKSRKSHSFRTLNKSAAFKFQKKWNRICHKPWDADNSRKHFLSYKLFVKKKKRNLLSEYPKFKLKLENLSKKNEVYGLMADEFKWNNLELKDQRQFLYVGNYLRKGPGVLAFHPFERVRCHPKKVNPFYTNGRERKNLFWMQNSRMRKLLNTKLSLRNAYSEKDSSPTFSEVAVNCEESGNILELQPEILRHSFKSELYSSILIKKNIPVCLTARSLLFKGALEHSLHGRRHKMKKEIYSNRWVKNTPKVRRKFPTPISQNTKSLKNVWQNCKPLIGQNCSKEEILGSKLNFSHFSSVDCWTMTGGQQMERGMRSSLRNRTCAGGVGNKGGKGTDNKQNKNSSDSRGDQGNRRGRMSPNCKKDDVQVPYKPDGVGDNDEDGNGKDNGSDEYRKRRNDVDKDDTDEGDESDESEDESDEDGDVNLSLNCPLCGSLLNSTEEARQHLLDHKTGKLNESRWTGQIGQSSTAGNASTRQKNNSTVKILGSTDKNSYKLTYRSSGVEQVPNGTREITFVQPTKPVVKHLYSRHRKSTSDLEQIVVHPSEPVVRLCAGSAEDWLTKYIHPDEQSGFKENEDRSTCRIDCQELKQCPKGSPISEKQLPRGSKMRNEFRSEMDCVDVDKGVEVIDFKSDKITQHDINRTLDQSKLSEQGVLGHNNIFQPFGQMLKLRDDVSRSIMSERKLGKERIGSFSGSFPPKKDHFDKKKKKQHTTDVGETKLLHYESVAFNQARSGTKEVFLVSPLDNSSLSSSQARDKPKRTLNSVKDLTSKKFDLGLQGSPTRNLLVSEAVDNEDFVEVVVDSDVDESYHEMSRNLEGSGRSQDACVSSKKNTAKLKKKAKYKSESFAKMLDNSCLNSLDGAPNSRISRKSTSRNLGVEKFGNVKTHDRLSVGHCQGHISPPDPPLLIADVRSVKSEKTTPAAATSQINQKSQKRKRGKNRVQKGSSKNVSLGCVASMDCLSSNQGVRNHKDDLTDVVYPTRSTSGHAKFPERVGDLYSDSSNDSSSLDLRVTFLNEETQFEDNSCSAREVDTERERNEKGEVISDSDEVILGEITFMTDSERQENTASSIQSETVHKDYYSIHQSGEIGDVKTCPQRMLLRSASKLSSSSVLSSQSITSSFKNAGSADTLNKVSKRNLMNEKSNSSKERSPSSTEPHHSSNHFRDQDSHLGLPLLITDVRSVMPEEFSLFGAIDNSKSIEEKNGRTSAEQSAIKKVTRDRERDDISNDLPMAYQPEKKQSEVRGSLKGMDADEQMLVTGGVTLNSNMALPKGTIHNFNDKKQSNELPFIKPELIDPEYDGAHPSVCDKTEPRKITPIDDHQQPDSSWPLIKTEIFDPIFDNIHSPSDTIDTRPLSSENPSSLLPSLLPSSVLSASNPSFPSSIISSILSSSNDKLPSNPRIIKIMKKKRNLGETTSKNMQNLHKGHIAGIPPKPNSNVGVRRSEFSPAYLAFKDMVLKKGIKEAERVVRNVPPKEPSLIYVFPKKPVVNLGKQKQDSKDPAMKHGGGIGESNPDVGLSATLIPDEADKEQARQTKITAGQAQRKTETLNQVAAMSTQENAKSQEKGCCKTGRKTAARKRTKTAKRQKKDLF